MSDLPNFSKSERKRLRELCGRAELAELSQHLRELQAEFANWESRKLDTFELNQKILEFHQGPSRDVYSFYRNLPPSDLVARAVTRGFLSETEIGEILLRKLQPRIDDMRRYFTNGPATEADDDDEDESKLGAER